MRGWEATSASCGVVYWLLIPRSLGVACWLPIPQSRGSRLLRGACTRLRCARAAFNYLGLLCRVWPGSHVTLSAVLLLRTAPRCDVEPEPVFISLFYWRPSVS